MIEIKPILKSVRVADEEGFIPSQKKYKLQSKIALKGFKREREKVQALLLIPSALRANLIVNRENSLAKKRAIKLECTQELEKFEVHTGEYLIFEAKINPRDIKEIDKFRSGRSLEAKVELWGNAVVSDENGEKQVIDRISRRSTSKVTITPSQFQKDFFEKVKLGGREVIEVQYEFPEIIEEKAPSEMREPVKALRGTFNALKKSRGELESAKTASDYRSILGDVRSSLDSLRSEIKKIGDYLYYETSTFRGGGAKKASKRMARDLGDAIGAIYQITSKSGHSTTAKKPKKMWEFRPKKEDVEPILAALSMILQHILDKLEKSFLEK
ncbi:hypothetical protein AKJ36_01235 [candidate division MSBL1 archaeon SCGC-AAA259I07]|uniref:Uncharacterized protein n=1 Tax=candidate division MSBL1 archaeon SCGC-AAA259I07 TaxID=1698266 RepID=A0A133ULX5_9EURY|nr:hypothetical protein AKJ36_01235 [candidate division MSBL1 archaeon SCGC-AAA259I07]